MLGTACVKLSGLKLEDKEFRYHGNISRKFQIFIDSSLASQKKLIFCKLFEAIETSPNFSSINNLKLAICKLFRVIVTV